MTPHNWKHCVALGLLALTFGAHAHASQKPDIQRALSTTADARSACGVVNARMTYLDSKGRTQVLEYMKFTDTCGDGN